MPLRFAQLQLTPEAVQVLKDSGIEDINALAQANVSDLQGAFMAAAKNGRYPDKFPSLIKIASWVDQAGSLVGRQPEHAVRTNLDDIPMAVVKPSTKRKTAYAGSGAQAHVRKLELNPDRHRPRKRSAEPREASGERVPLTPRGEGADVADVLEELNPEHLRVLHQRRAASVLIKSKVARADAEVEKAAALSEKTPPTPRDIQASESQAEPPAGSEAEPKTAVPFKSFDDYKQGRIGVKPLDRHSLKVGEDPNRSTSSEQESFEEEQVYKKRMPIWRLRGVRHPDGRRVYLGAFITFMAILLTVAMAVGAAVFPLYLEAYRVEFAALFFLMLVFWILYIVAAAGMRCRVCSCHLFYSRRCLKNSKAHRIFRRFPMLAQTIHILLWRWFRCMYCGTAIRLRDDRDDESARH